MWVTPRNTPIGARLAGSSGSVSGEDEYIPSQEECPYGQRDCVEICSLFYFIDNNNLIFYIYYMNTFDIQAELDLRINALRCEYSEFTSMHNRKLIPTKEWIVVARQITLEIVELTNEYLNA